MTIRLLCVVGLMAVSVTAFAQHRKPPRPKEVLDKRDRLTLRYKPQAGTLLYNIRTDISQSVKDQDNVLRSTVRTSAQLAIHNVAIDYTKGSWSFDRYFTKFQIEGEDLRGNALSIREPGAVNKITRFTYLMTGDEVKREVITPIILLNADAQTYAYFIRPPTLLGPLPKHLVTYGDTWFEHTNDTIPVRDTINIGITEGTYIYNIDRTYQLDRLEDSVGSNTAIIIASNTGSFVGSQSNTVTGISMKLHGPITGVDTIYLDLFSGRVISRTTDLSIPVHVETEGRPPLEDLLQVRRKMTLDESNAIKNKQ